MTGEEFLKKVLNSSRTMESKIEQFMRMQNVAQRITTAINGTPTISQKSYSKIENAVTEVINSSEAIGEEIANYWEMYFKAKAEIGKVKEERERLLLEYKYLSMKSWSEIAKTMNLAKRYVYRLHGKALQSFEKIFLSEEQK